MPLLNFLKPLHATETRYRAKLLGFRRHFRNAATNLTSAEPHRAQSRKLYLCRASKTAKLQIRYIVLLPLRYTQRNLQYSQPRDLPCCCGARTPLPLISHERRRCRPPTFNLGRQVKLTTLHQLDTNHVRTLCSQRTTYQHFWPNFQQLAHEIFHVRIAWSDWPPKLHPSSQRHDRVAALRRRSTFSVPHQLGISVLAKCYTDCILFANIRFSQCTRSHRKPQHLSITN